MMLFELLAVSRLTIALHAVVDKPGEYCLEHSRSCVTLASGEGEALVIAVPDSKAGPKDARDVNGLAWLGPREIVFSTSATYGRPGIYRYDMKTRRESTVVPSRTRDAAYPNGKDFFKLVSVDGDGVTFWYSEDIERVDQEDLERTSRREHAPLKTKPRE